MIKKFFKIFDAFKVTHSYEINMLRSKINFHYAMDSWEKGKGLEARKLLQEYRRLDRKYILLYLVSIFPYSFFRRLIDFRRVQRHKYKSMQIPKDQNYWV